jgi:L-serine dehydratase
LLGADPETILAEAIQSRVQDIVRAKRIRLAGGTEVAFDPREDIIFHADRQLPYHPNALRFTAGLEDGERIQSDYYSIGGGFIVAEGETQDTSTADLPYPIDTARQLLDYCESQDYAISAIVRCNERYWRSDTAIDVGLDELQRVMLESIQRGCRHDGELPGGLGVKRRAGKICRDLLADDCPASLAQWLDLLQRQPHEFQRVLDWVSCFALAVNEENAAFGRVVTAPTNGAAGVIPAVLLYATCFCGISPEQQRNFLLTAGEIGCLFKKGATISAAQGGCQAEIGVSSAMAAAALAECLGGRPAQCAVAAEIAMEHHLGMTCDPVAGLVQIPCIERNAMGAVKAITSAQLALHRQATEARVTLDAVIRTMWETAQDMNSKYKETSEGGLAAQIAVNVSEC